jgi:hypothetical protein
MNIDKGASAYVIISRDWANLRAIRIFLRQNHEPEREIRGTDDSHIVYAKILDSDDPHGLWIELNTAKHREDSAVKRYNFLIPWGSLLGIVVSEEFSPEIREEVRKLGF